MEIRLKNTNHDFEKQNLVTLKGRKGTYDLMKCKHCGMTGKRINIETVTVGNNYSFKNANDCPKAPKVNIENKRIKVTFCTANGKAFSNLTPHSEHDIVTPPEGYKNDHTGVWVMGVGEPVKLLSDEFTFINE